MDGLSIPERQDDPDDKSRRSDGGKRRAEDPQRRRPRILSVEDCLAALSQLPALTTMGMLTTTRVNTIRSVYTTILQYHERQQSGPSRTITNEKGLAELLREQPQLASLLEPVLTDEQIEMFVRGGKDADHAEEAP
jgi:hypothetical protein